jgi:8-amino-7-oxononanoate synthase
VYTTGTPPALAAAALAALDILEKEPERRVRVRANARRLRAGLAAQGWPAAGPADGHIVPVVIGASEATMAVGTALEEAGLLVGAIRPPTVPQGTARLRITVSASHDADAIDVLLGALAAVLPSPP